MGLPRWRVGLTVVRCASGRFPTAFLSTGRAALLVFSSLINPSRYFLTYTVKDSPRFICLLESWWKPAPPLASRLHYDYLPPCDPGTIVTAPQLVLPPARTMGFNALSQQVDQ